MLYYMFTINHAILYCILHIYCYKAIEEIYGENPRDTTVFWGKEPSRWLFQKNKKKILIWSRRVCVPIFRSVPFSVWSGGSVQANIYTSELKKNTLKLRHVDFDKYMKFEVLCEFNWIERISFIEICIGWLVGIYRKGNLRVVLRDEIYSSLVLAFLIFAQTWLWLVTAERAGEERMRGRGKRKPHCTEKNNSVRHF